MGRIYPFGRFVHGQDRESRPSFIITEGEGDPNRKNERCFHSLFMVLFNLHNCTAFNVWATVMTS